MDKHISELCKSCFYHLRALRHIRSSITDDVAKTIACSFVGARLDYANSVLYGVSKQNITRLQRIQNATARVVVGSAASEFISSLAMLQHLHWLPVDYRIKFKMAKLAYQARSSVAPACLTKLISCYTPCRHLRSADSNMLTVPRYNLVFGSRGFRIAAPTVFNSLPLDIRLCTSTQSFCRHLKTFYCRMAFAEL